MRALARRVPLRRALVATLLLVVTLALVGSGVATHAALRGYLLDRVDDQLRGAAPLVADGTGALVRPGRRGGAEAPESRGPLPSAFVVQVVDADGGLVLGPTSNLVDDEPLPDLPDRPTCPMTRERRARSRSRRWAATGSGASGRCGSPSTTAPWAR